MTMHQNSLFSWRHLDMKGRKASVCAALEEAGRAMTDREVCGALGSEDMNYARPAITHLVDEGVLIEAEHVECPVTGRRVRRVWFK